MLRLKEKITQKNHCFCISKEITYKWKNQLPFYPNEACEEEIKNLKEDLVLTSQAYEDTTNIETFPSITKSVTLYSKADGKGDSFVIFGTLSGWSKWSKWIKKHKKGKKSFRFFEDSTTVSTLTERKRFMPCEVTNPNKG